jgi:hypothetical protein
MLSPDAFLQEYTEEAALGEVPRPDLKPELAGQPCEQGEFQVGASSR